MLSACVKFSGFFGGKLLMKELFPHNRPVGFFGVVVNLVFFTVLFPPFSLTFKHLFSVFISVLNSFYTYSTAPNTNKTIY